MDGDCLLFRAVSIILLCEQSTIVRVAIFSDGTYFSDISAYQR